MKLPRLKSLWRGPKLRMPALFRWRYVLPRVAILAVVYSAVRWGLDPLLKTVLVAGGEAALGAKVEVADVRTSILGGEIVIDGLAAANRNKPMQNLAEAEHISLRVDVGSLLRKRVVVKDGVVRGLKFGSERTTSGALPDSPMEDAADAGPSMLAPVAAAAGDAAVEWFGNLQDRLEEDLESKLATPRVVRELEGRWKEQYAALKQRADELRAQAKQIEHEFREAKKNPLRAVAILAALQTQLATTQAELNATVAEIQSLPAQAQADRQAVDAARQQDQAFLKESLAIAKTDGGQLSEYLLGETVHGAIAQTVAWIDYARSWIPKSKIERPARARGTTVLFGETPRPKCLIERVALTGTARLAGQPLEVTGLLTDASTQPELHPRPLQLHVVAGGAMAGDLLVTIDRRGGESRDTLVLDCPHLVLPKRTLGRADKLAVSVAAGEASIAADIALDGQRLSGSIRMHQKSTLAATTPAVRNPRIAEMMTASLNGVDRLEATIQLAGTLQRPRWELDSNVGPQLAEGMSGAMRKYLVERRDRALAKTQVAVDQQLAQLAAARNQAQQELLGALGENQELVTQLAAMMGGKAPANSVSIPQMSSALDRLQR